MFWHLVCTPDSFLLFFEMHVGLHILISWLNDVFACRRLLLAVCAFILLLIGNFRRRRDIRLLPVNVGSAQFTCLAGSFKRGYEIEVAQLTVQSTPSALRSLLLNTITSIEFKLTSVMVEIFPLIN